MTGKLIETECKAQRVWIGRWHGVREEDRECKKCENEEVEDIDHFAIRCEHAAEERLMTGWKNGMSWVTIKMCGDGDGQSV